MWACFMLARVRTPSSPVRERERESERGRDRQKEREGVTERERERKRQKRWQLLKGMMGASAPFSYLV